MDSVNYLTADQVLGLHAKALTIGIGGAEGLRSEHLLLSAVFQPQQTFGGEDLYPSIPEKAAAYGFFIADSSPKITLSSMATNGLPLSVSSSFWISTATSFGSPKTKN